MFQIISNNTLPDLNIEDRQSITIPCFFLTNDNSSTSIVELSNFAPMFKIESREEEILDIETFSYTLTTTPSVYQMLEINIEDLQPLDNISTLYLNGSKYQNLLDIENLVIFPSKKETLPLEEREST